MNQYPRILQATDRLLAALVVALVLGERICFGGAVWWFRPALAVLAFMLSLTMIVHLLLERRMPFFKSPLTLAGVSRARAGAASAHRAARFACSAAFARRARDLFVRSDTGPGTRGFSRRSA